MSDVTPAEGEHRMITTDTDPWDNRDAAKAAGYARWHADARATFEANKTPGLANAMTRIQDLREAHQANTGWVAEPLGQGRWRFVYMDPKTRFTGGQPITITSKEKS